MTNEEIKRLYEETTSREVLENCAQSLHDYDAIDEAILRFGRMLVERTSEEAAAKFEKIADSISEDADAGGWAVGIYEAVEQLRAMRSSLAAEPVSS